MENNLPFVSIVIANYNGKHLLSECFDSLYAQQYPPSRYEIIFVDNCSGDDSVAFVKHKYPLVIVLENTENNYCKALNLGIVHAKGHYIALVNNDTKADVAWLGELVKVIEQDKSVSSVGSKILTFDGRIQNASHYELPNFYWGERGAGQEAKLFEHIEKVPSLCGAAVLHRRSALFEIGLFDEDFVIYGEDVDVAYRLSQKGYKLLFVPDSIMYHKFHGSGNESFARYYIERNRLLYIAKHFPEKLSASLLGSGYLTAKHSLDSLGKLYAVLPDVIIKLIRVHGPKKARQVIADLMDELRRSSNYESDLLAKLIKEALSDKDLLNQSLQQIRIKVFEQENELVVLKECIANQNRIFSEKEIFIKNIEERLHKLSEQKEEFRTLSEQKENELCKLSEQKENELRKLSEQKEEELGRLRIDNELELSNLSREKEGIRSELDGIYASEGYRFVLKPLWMAVLGFRTFCQKVNKLFRKSCWYLIFSPVFLLVRLSLALERMIWIALGPLLTTLAKKRPSLVASKGQRISVVIPNYNGEHILKESLPTIFCLDEFKNGTHEVLIVDDSSTDDSVVFIQNFFPQARIVRNRRNEKFGAACNRGVKEARHEIVLLINNDIKLTEHFLGPLLKELKDDVFVVSPKMFGWDKERFVWGMHMGRFENGYVRLWNECDTSNGDKITQVSPSIFAIGGAMLFRKRDFLWLGGFDHIYRPNCWEDIDISYRAWKRGLKVSYVPESIMYHKGRATLTYERPKEIKNELLFIWKNITDSTLLNEHVKNLPQLLHANGMNFAKALLWAIMYLPSALVHKLMERSYVRVSDRKILDHCMNYYRSFERRGLRHRLKDEKKNLLLITPFLPYPVNKGGAIRIHNLAIRLKDDYNVYLLSLIHHKDEEIHLEKLRQIYSGVYTATSSPNKIGRSFPRRYAYSYSCEMIFLLEKLQKELPLDIIQIESNELLYLLDHIKHVPCVYTEHDSSVLFHGDSYYKRLAHENAITSFFDYLKRLYFHCMAYKRLQNVIVLSERDKSIINSFFPKTNLTFIPTGVDFAQFHYAPPVSRPKKLIFVGHYLHYPNEEAVLYFVSNVFPKIKKRIPEIEFIIVGSAPTESIMKLAEIPNIKVVGEVADVSVYLSQAAIFVNPIISSWGIKGKLLEAMAAGLPVVSTSRGAAGINTNNGCGIIYADTPLQFACAIERLFNEKDYYDFVSRSGRAITERYYNWDTIARSLKYFYEQVTEAVLTSTQVKPKGTVGIQEAVEAANWAAGILLHRVTPEYSEQAGPLELHIELDYSCNSRCVMCDLWDYDLRFPSKKTLTMEEIKDCVSGSERLQGLGAVLLSGGEPFIHKDLVKVAGYFLDTFPGVSLGILTNGLDTEKIISQCRDIISTFQPKNFWLGSSLDGVGAVHDRVRGVKGAFARLECTLQACKKENIPITLTFTVTSQNYDQLLLAHKFAKQVGVELCVQIAVPKEARHRFVFQLNPAQLEVVEHDINEIIREKMQGIDWEDFVINPLQDKFRGQVAQLYYLSHLVKYHRLPRRYFQHCLAGRRFAMLSPHGELYFCPGLKQKILGNIRTEPFDDIWSGARAIETRDCIRQGVCHCWLVCIVFPLMDGAWKAY